MDRLFDPSGTTLSAAQANVRASSQAQVDLLNRNLTALYLSAFHDWTVNVLAGKIDNANPPKPPNGFVVAEFEDATAPGVKWAFPSQTGGPVCEMPPVPADQTKPQPAPAIPVPQNVMNVPPGDTMPVGYIVVAPDGSRWQKQMSVTPFGVVYYIARIS